MKTKTISIIDVAIQNKTKEELRQWTKQLDEELKSKKQTDWDYVQRIIKAMNKATAKGMGLI